MNKHLKDFNEAKALATRIAATLTRQEVATALNVSLDALDKIHERGKGPPRFRSSPGRWAYPLPEFRAWQERRLAEADGQSEGT